MGESFVNGQTGTIVDGVIINKTVASGYTVKPGQFVADVSSVGTSMKLGSSYSPSINSGNVGVCWITDNKYLLVYFSKSLPGMEARVLTVNSDGSVSSGNVHYLDGSYMGYGGISICRISSNQAVVVTDCAYRSSRYYQILLTISGTTVTSTYNTEGNEGYNTMPSDVKFFSSVGRTFMGRVYNISDDNGWPRGVKARLLNGASTVQTNTRDNAFPYDGRLLGVCGASSGTSAYVVGLCRNTIYIEKYTISASSITYVGSKTVSQSITFTTSGKCIVDFDDGTFGVFTNNYFTCVRINANTGAIVDTVSKSSGLPVSLIDGSPYMYGSCLFSSTDKFKIGYFDLSTGNLTSTVTSEFSIGSGNPIVAFCRGAYGSVIVTADTSNYLYVNALNEGVRPANTGDLCFGIAKSGGSGGDTIKVLGP